MSDLSEIVDSLENRISKLLHRHDTLKQANEALEEELRNLKSEQDQYLKDIEQWRDTCSSLKLANSMLGSDQYKRETKLKINALVREIDQCIVQLSE
jgi:vacuolar-type H+-ATPase subunit D/Vma8